MPTQTRQPGTITELADGTTSWDNQGNVAAQDAAYAVAPFIGGSADVPTNTLRCTNFGFTLPPGSVINSVTARVRRSSFSAGAPVDGVTSDFDIYEWYGSRVGTNKADPTYWPDADDDQTYSLGVTNTWFDLNDEDWGIEFSAQQTSDVEAVDAKVDVIEVTIDYSPGDPLPAPPPFPGSGGLNTGGAFFAMMVNQQRGG